MSRRQLPPQIRKLEVTDRKTGKLVVRYEVTVDAGIGPETGKRQQVRRRYATEQQARKALAEVQNGVTTGAFVSRSQPIDAGPLHRECGAAPSVGGAEV
jgi:hypothetical protein